MEWSKVGHTRSLRSLEGKGAGSPNSNVSNFPASVVEEYPRTLERSRGSPACKTFFFKTLHVTFLLFSLCFQQYVTIISSFLRIPLCIIVLGSDQLGLVCQWMGPVSRTNSLALAPGWLCPPKPWTEASWQNIVDAIHMALVLGSTTSWRRAWGRKILTIKLLLVAVATFRNN